MSSSGGDHGRYGEYGRPDSYDQYGQYGQYGAQPTPPADGQYGQYGGQPAPPADNRYGQFGAAPRPGEGSWSDDTLAGGQPGIVPLRPLRVGEILEGAFRAVRHNPGTMFFYAGIVSVITGALSVFSLWSTNQAVLSSTDLAQGAAGDAAVMAQLALGIVTAVTSLIATGALVVSVSQSVIGQKVSLGQVWRAVRGRVWSLIGLSLLIVLIAIGFVIVTSIIFALLLVTVFSAMLGTFTGDVTEEGFMLVLGLTLLALALSAIPAFIIATRLSVSFSAVVLEKAGPGTAMSRSWRLTRGSTWRLIGLYVLMAIIAVIVTSALGVPVALLAETLGLSPGLSLAASAVVGVLANLIVTPFTAGVLSLAYIDLRIRSEGLDVQLAQAAARA